MEHLHDDNCSHDHPQDEGINWEKVQQWVQTGILFLLALYMIDLALPGGNLANYINVQNFGWLTWVGALILFAIAGMNAYELLQNTHHHDHHHEHDHSHTPAGSFSSWVFLGIASIPLVLGLGVPSKPLGAGAVNNISADVRSIGLGNSTSVSAILPENRNLLDWVRTFAASPDMREFEGQEVKVIGFVYEDARLAGSNNFMVVRFTLNCCVADARPIGLVVQNAAAEDYAQDTWIEVTGTITIQEFDGVETPIIQAQSITPTLEPEQPYLYF